MRITLKHGPHGTYEIVPNHPTLESILVQTDWDWPCVASTFGWSPCHNQTDGTVDCPVCGTTATTLIQKAADYLDNHIGDTADDPGYFPTPNHLTERTER